VKPRVKDAPPTTRPVGERVFFGSEENRDEKWFKTLRVLFDLIILL
jgi:hypothetical protein